MKKRVISAIVAIAIIIPLFLIGGWVFNLGVAVIAALAYLEILSLNRKAYSNGIRLVGFLCLELITLSSFDTYFFGTGLSFLSISLTFLLLTIPAIFDTKDRYTTKEAFRLIGFIILVGLFFNLIIISYTKSKWLLLYLILIGTITDTFAYIVGTLIGKHKLIPKVSPKKSVEGSVGGSLIATIIATIYYVKVIPSNLNIVIVIAMTLILSILGQLGDLFFSKIKREYEIKDFSNIMPGHGGILDRLDSLSFILLGYMVIVTILNMII